MVSGAQAGPTSGGVQVIRRAGGALRAVADRPGELRLADLAPILGLPKTTVHRVVNALVDEELLRVDPHGQIWLGAAIVSMGRVAARDLAGLYRPVLEELGRLTGETVDLAVLDGTGVRFIDQVPSAHRLQAVSAVGSVFPLHCTANGKALLAALPPDRAAALLPRRLEECTPNTITTRAALEVELDWIRASGIAEDREEHTLGIRALGIAVTDGGDPIAAISIPVPTERFDVAKPAVRAALVDANRAAVRLSSGSPSGTAR